MSQGRTITLWISFAMTAPFAALPQTSAGRLDFSDSIRMIDCDPASSAPAFRLKFNIVDGQGAPLPAQLPPPEKLAGSISVMVGNQPVTPFFAAAGGGERQTVRGRTALVLLDISGSMNRPLASGETRFQAAKNAASSFLEGFQDGVDRIAIIPFESHNVESTIRAAKFASTKQDALAEVQAIPLPQSRNNTGLYTAVAVGLNVIAQELAQRPAGGTSPEVMVMLMTDGKNEVFKGDDAGLLDGSQGLEQAASKVKASGIQVVAVGFGNPADIDETALRQISTKYYMATDAGTLTRIFSVARTLLSSRIQASFVSPWPDRASLAGRTLRVSMRLKMPSGQELVSEPKIWAAPQIGLPVYEGHCDVDEMKALYTGTAPTGTAWLSALRPVLVFIGLGTLLLILWFWVPRLVWRDQYGGMVVPTTRWAGGAPQRPGRPSPPGFQPGKASQPAPRRPMDETMIAPRDFSQTRLNPIPEHRPGPKK